MHVNADWTRLLHSPSLVAIELTMLMAVWLVGPDNIDWGTPHQHWIVDKLRCIIGPYDRREFPWFFMFFLTRNLEFVLFSKATNNPLCSPSDRQFCLPVIKGCARALGNSLGLPWPHKGTGVGNSPQLDDPGYQLLMKPLANISFIGMTSLWHQGAPFTNRD